MKRLFVAQLRWFTWHYLQTGHSKSKNLIRTINRRTLLQKTISNILHLFRTNKTHLSFKHLLVRSHSFINKTVINKLPSILENANRMSINISMISVVLLQQQKTLTHRKDYILNVVRRKRKLMFYRTQDIIYRLVLEYNCDSLLAETIWRFIWIHPVYCAKTPVSQSRSLFGDSNK